MARNFRVMKETLEEFETLMEMQIERAAWPDNGCSVDSTSLHACLNAEAMRYVLDLVPEPHRKDVTFSNTFHWPHKSLFEAATPDKFERDYGDQCGGFYIHIPKHRSRSWGIGWCEGVGIKTPVNVTTVNMLRQSAIENGRKRMVRREVLCDKDTCECGKILCRVQCKRDDREK